MLLAVEKATPNDVDFAWGLYRDFIVTNIYEKHQIAKPLDKWIAEEEDSFKQQWEGNESYLISIDNESVGWLSSATAGEKVTIENVFIVEQWQNKGIGEKIIEQITPQLRSAGKVVEIPVLIGTKTSAGIERTLSGLGYSTNRHDGPHRIYSIG